MAATRAEHAFDELHRRGDDLERARVERLREELVVVDVNQLAGRQDLRAGSPLHENLALTRVQGLDDMIVPSPGTTLGGVTVNST